MNSEYRGKNVEKSSREDEEVSKIMSQSRRNEQAIIVMGEASESDEEEIQQHVDQSTAKKPGDPHFNKLDKSQNETSNKKKSGEKRTLQTSKYQSLLHTKLRERNIHLRKMIVDTLLQSYEMSARDVQNISQNLAKSQILVQEVGPTLRQTTSELFQLEVKLDSVLENCKNLSKIK